MSQTVIRKEGVLECDEENVKEAINKELDRFGEEYPNVPLDSFSTWYDDECDFYRFKIKGIKHE